MTLAAEALQSRPPGLFETNDMALLSHIQLTPGATRDRWNRYRDTAGDKRLTKRMIRAKRWSRSPFEERILRPFLTNRFLQRTAVKRTEGGSPQLSRADRINQLKKMPGGRGAKELARIKTGGSTYETAAEKSGRQLVTRLKGMPGGRGMAALNKLYNDAAAKRSGRVPSPTTVTQTGGSQALAARQAATKKQAANVAVKKRAAAEVARRKAAEDAAKQARFAKLSQAMLKGKGSASKSVAGK